MDILHYNKAINVEELLDMVDSKRKILLIIPDKYRFFIYKNILAKSKIVFNLTLLSPNNFLKSILSDNNIVVDEQTALIKKIQINNKLKNEHPYQDNLNFINELFKLKQELFYSNIEYNDKYSAYLDYERLSFDKLNLHVSYDRIIYCDEDFYPIHQQLLNSLSVAKTKQVSSSLVIDKKYYEHSNTIRMLDYVVKDIYEKEYQNLLIVADDPIQQNYLISTLNKLNIAVTNLTPINNLECSLIKSLFALISRQANEHDHKNLKLLNLDIEKTTSLIDESYHDYLQKLYHILIEINLFDLGYLNNLFTKLYLIKNANLTTLNKLLVNEFINHLNTPTVDVADIVIADSSYTSLFFENVIVVDASLKNFSANKTSYLLNTQQRSAINDDLISNTYYLNEFHLKQQRLLTCGNRIMFHYTLLTLDNKSQDLAYFIKLNHKRESGQDRLTLENEHDGYLHLTIDHKKEDSILINNQTRLLDKDNLLKRFNHQIKISSSSLDEFYSCPYKYLISKVYKPRPPKDFSYLTLGNIHHQVIEVINQKLIETNQSFATYPYDRLIEIVDNETYHAIYQDNATNYEGVIKENVLMQVKDNLINFIDSMIYYEQFSKFRINASEKELSSDYPNDYFNNVSLVGKVDAIMAYDKLSYVLDYKSSENKFSEKDLISGRKNQLVMYLKLLHEHGYLPFGAFYKAINDRFIDVSSEMLNRCLSDVSELKILQQLKNPYRGIAFRNHEISLFDYQLSEEKSSILDIKSKQAFNRIFKENIDNEDFNYYLSILDNNINNMLQQLESTHFEAKPLSKQECSNCQYKVICKYYFNSFNGEEQDDE